MDWKEWYLWGQENCGIQVGDKVRVLFKAKNYQWGWDNTWDFFMDEAVGKTLQVLMLNGEYGIRLESGKAILAYPFFVLELVEKAPEPEPKSTIPPDVEEHLLRHKELHKALDELLADFITHTENLPSKTTILTFVNWSYEQTIKSTEKEEKC